MAEYGCKGLTPDSAKNRVGDEEMPDAGHAGAGADAAAAASAAADRLMSVTRALLLINADHGSAWNARKEVVTDGRYGTVRDEIKVRLPVARCS